MVNPAWPIAAPIETARLRLEPLEPAHADEMVAVLAAPELYAFIGGEPPSPDALRRRYEVQARGHAADGSAGWLNWIARRHATGDAVGYVQATVTDTAGDRTADIAWLVAPEHQGAGIATEAAAAMAARRPRAAARVTDLCDPA